MTRGRVGPHAATMSRHPARSSLASRRSGPALRWPRRRERLRGQSAPGDLIGHAGAAEAEYRAHVLGLEQARACGVEEVEVRCDSQLAVRAIRAGAPVAAPVLEAARGFGSVRWVWHPRDENEAADALVRELLWPTTPSP